MSVRRLEAVRADALGEASQTTRWAIPISVAVFSILTLVAVYLPTFQSIVSIWIRSDTYMHCFLILPISGYLAWNERYKMAGVTPRPDFRPLLFLALAGAAWLLSTLADVLVVAQYAVVASIPLVVWGVMGEEVARRLAFPLVFLLLAVPVGEALIPPLIDFTAAFTVLALNVTGIPVLKEANFLTLPNGRWSVVEACSGLRYLIASLTVGLLFAYLTYKSLARRAAFVALSIVVPIIANGFRAYMIVMLGYLSDMRLAVGVDHLIYGWVFFGFVMCLLFWIGSRFRDSAVPSDERNEPVDKTAEQKPRAFIGIGVACITIIAIAPAWAAYAEARAPDPPVAADSFPFPTRIDAWTSVNPMTDWKPYFRGAQLSESQAYQTSSGWVGLHVDYYWQQSQGAELVGSRNGFTDPADDRWRRLTRSRGQLVLAGESLGFTEAFLDARNEEILAWSWYWVDGRFTSSRPWAKILEAGSRLLGRSPCVAGVTIFTTATNGEEVARENMKDFLRVSLDDIEDALQALAR